MKTIKIERAHVYNFGFGECLMILDTIYGIDDKVKVAYVVGDTIKGYITTKKVYSSYPRGAYILFGGRRYHLDDFMECLLYNTEYKQEARHK